MYNRSELQIRDAVGFLTLWVLRRWSSSSRPSVEALLLASPPSTGGEKTGPLASLAGTGGVCSAAGDFTAGELDLGTTLAAGWGRRSVGATGPGPLENGMAPMEFGSTILRCGAKSCERMSDSSPEPARPAEAVWGGACGLDIYGKLGGVRVRLGPDGKV